APTSRLSPSGAPRLCCRSQSYRVRPLGSAPPGSMGADRRVAGGWPLRIKVVVDGRATVVTAPGGEGDTTVQVVGIGADGWDCLPAGHRAVISAAEVLLGGDRQLSLMPDSVTAVRRRWPSPLRENLPGLLGEYAGRRVVALASGDPLLSGVGGTLVNLLGPRRVQVHPTVSSAALARARMGWSAESADLVRVVGRDPSAVLRIVSPGRWFVVLSSDGVTRSSLAALIY